MKFLPIVKPSLFMVFLDLLESVKELLPDMTILPTEFCPAALVTFGCVFREKNPHVPRVHFVEEAHDVHPFGQP